MDLLTTNVTRQESGGRPYTLVELTGEADVTTSEMLRDLLAAQIAREPGKLIIDLAALRFMDSAALRVILTASRSLAGRGGTLALAAPPGSWPRCCARPRRPGWSPFTKACKKPWRADGAKRASS